ncbi:MAG: tRNA (adenosine(37)-N6)-threonylcarbamoyltransferase complex ATPase subunit type 1 TsaE [Planctomycetes bacterium HGW-Planctomycetes-1]|nr:MAG: tRNA (adenosine(37)-N6)-threonylcarbamoyltransferase complex ATPase subunit type 1 TsaE [Planctomycetes bacterium HGW-Planctomycetes-1]
MSSIQIISDSVERTFEIGKRIGEMLEGGKVVCLTGPLGSGKTTLIKGIASGLGADKPSQVNSPTFVIVNEYQGRVNIFHIDAYRINKVSEFEALGFEEFIGPESIVLIEWADKVAQALKGQDCIYIDMQHNGQASRKMGISGLKNAQTLKS